MILITGSSGFIGTNVTRYFIQKGEDVVGVDVSEPQKSFEREQFTLHRCDLTDRTSVSKAFKKFKPEKVVHLAFVTRPKEPYREFLDDARITLNMLQSALEHDVQRFVLMSSSTVYGLHKEDRFVEEEEILDPRGVYGKAKLTAEMMAKEYLKSQNLPVVILRGFEIYGPYLTPPTIVKI
ncbi:MAG: NAD(P)-dependent oxidoreductase, partial [Candidatus Bathyarchaeota archaeon]